MASFHKPLKRSVLTGSIVFIVLLCLVLSLSQYLRYRATLYAHYEHYIENILNYAAAGIDTDDLAECIRTGVESEKYRALQTRLDDMRDHMDMHFLYVIIPLNTEQRDNIVNVIAGVSQYEYENLADELVSLNMPAGDSYSPETAKKYLDAYNSGKLSFFEEVSEWRDDYTGLLPLYDSAGQRVAALCVDVDAEEIHSSLRHNTVQMLAIILLLGVVFTVSFVLWTDRIITRPIQLLERCVVKFATISHDQKDPEKLQLDVPDIRTDNEVASLAHAIEKMSEDMQSYVKGIVYAETQAARMEALANKDALTKVRNKRAYDDYVLGMKEQFQQQPMPFAVVMVDLNYLKRTNDTYGHEKGNRYLVACTGMICEVYRHSPVFRIGGDEFVVILTGRDYANRAALLRQVRRDTRRTEQDKSLPAWERVSIAVGMAEYQPKNDRSIEDVFSRADGNMYREKERMKVER